MCYDVSFSTRYESITDYLPDLIIEPSLALDFEMKAHVQAQAFNPYPVITLDDGQYVLKLFEWGVIADYMNTPEKVVQYRRWMCNARSDKVLDKKAFWYRIRKNRCLMPVTAIYEHREIKGWKNKVPYLVKMKKEKLFFIPSLYSYAPLVNKETGEMPGTFALVTRPANSLMARIHNADPSDPRMPLFVPADLAKRWLDPGLTDEQLAEILNFEMPSEMLEYYPVWTIRGKKPRPDEKPKTEPWVWEGLPELDSQGI